MPREDHPGEFEHLVMLAVLRLSEDAYGVTIRRTISERGGRAVSLGAVYSALRRLEGKGFLRSRSGQPEPVRGGRAKKFFLLEEKGLRALQTSLSRLSRMAADLDEVIFPLPESTDGGG